MSRIDIINFLISKYGFKSYLEIGVCNPEECFNHIVCHSKTSVDPGLEFDPNPVDFKMTSDQFFETIDPSTQWDLIFIDGLHISSQVQRDILNSLNHLSSEGIIVIHDCNPPEIWYAREDYYQNGQQMPWNGTVWKAIYWLRTHRSDLEVCVLDCDWGVGLVRRGSSELIDFDNPFYEYNQMIKDRQRNLNLIPVEELENWLQKKIQL